MKKYYRTRRIILIGASFIFCASTALSSDLKDVIKLVNRACVCLSAGKLDKSILTCDQAIKIDPRCAAAYYTRGFAFRYKGQFDRAILDFRQAIAIDPKYAGAYYALAKCYYDKNEFDESWENLHKAENLGHKAEPEFIKNLRKCSGRNK
ncbi:MAG: tetratricopeptide repeat protein [Candidatus Omnitrophota bacterium]